jgi:calcineurin-like phosphoesterase family protein
MYLLCTDLHLDDNQANEYRWRVFDEIKRVCQSRPVSCAYCLGDMTDKKVISLKAPVFSAGLVNRLVGCWKSLPGRKVILRGNHDATVTGPPDFWEFLSDIDGIWYVTRPTIIVDDLLLLPFSPNPRVEWDGVVTRDVRSIFVHATRSGTIAENGFPLRGQDLPPIPRRIKVYSGDVHIQQVVDNWTYVGAPHPVKFGDSYPCRILLLDERTYDIVEDIPIETISKRVVELRSLDDLSIAETRPGDQVKFRVVLPPGEVDWGALEVAVEEFARERGVEVASIEGSYDLPAQSGQPSEELPPEELLRAFAREEQVTDELLGVGLDLLREVSW